MPGPVGIPLTAENLSLDSCKLNWFFPENDGGSPISNYVIEKREAERKAWTSLSFTASRQNAIANGLTPGKSYFFRVAAENAIGLGPFVATAAEVLIKEPISESDRNMLEEVRESEIQFSAKQISLREKIDLQSTRKRRRKCLSQQIELILSFSTFMV